MKGSFVAYACVYLVPGQACSAGWTGHTHGRRIGLRSRSQSHEAGTQEHEIMKMPNDVHYATALNEAVSKAHNTERPALVDERGSP